MKARNDHYLIAMASIFVGLPLLLWAIGDTPARTFLKEAISITVLLAFNLMLGLFLLTGRNSRAAAHLTRRSAVKIHKSLPGFHGTKKLQN